MKTKTIIYIFLIFLSGISFTVIFLMVINNGTAPVCEVCTICPEPVVCAKPIVCPEPIVCKPIIETLPCNQTQIINQVNNITNIRLIRQLKSCEKRINETYSQVICKENLEECTEDLEEIRNLLD